MWSAATLILIDKQRVKTQSALSLKYTIVQLCYSHQERFRLNDRVTKRAKLVQFSALLLLPPISYTLPVEESTDESCRQVRLTCKLFIYKKDNKESQTFFCTHFPRVRRDTSPSTVVNRYQFYFLRVTFETKGRRRLTSVK